MAIQKKVSLGQTQPLNLVGSSGFGRYPKISISKTWNMIISDGWMVPYAGYVIRDQISDVGPGRGLFSSNRANFMIAVISNGVYRINLDFTTVRIGTLQTFSGDVYIDENNKKQIAISDFSRIYIYDYANNTFKTSGTDFPLDFSPGYISFQDSYFICTVNNLPQWRISAPNDGTNWPPLMAAPFQTKPDNPVAVVRCPGRGGIIYLIGSIVTEVWQNVGNPLFPYQRQSTYNIDYGTVNPATVATSDNFIIWIGINEKSGPVIMHTDGGAIRHISTDGIDFELANLKNPYAAFGFLFKQDGHLIYQFTFTEDNVSYAYDFNTQSFFNISNEKMDAHIAKRIAFFNNGYYFLSTIDGNIYQFSSQFTTLNGAIMPRIRVTDSVRMPDSSRFIVNNINFTIEQGDVPSSGYPSQGDPFDFIITQSGSFIITETGGNRLVTEPHNPSPVTQAEALGVHVPVVDLSISTNGGQSFGSRLRRPLNTSGNYRNKLDFYQLGAANDFIAQFEFWSLGRVVFTNGVINFYQ